jgi:hypothetical protein
VGVAVGSGDVLGEAEGTGDCEGDGVGVEVGPGLGVDVGVGVGVGVEIGVGVGDGVGYVVVADQLLYPWRLHKARARTEYVLVFEPRLYSTVKVVVL